MTEGNKPRPWGAVSAGVWVESHAQARAMQRALELAMKEFVGTEQERLFAKWHGEIVRIQRKAKRDKWTGWESE